ncbi:hypothetical protein HWV62_26789 [Athelia sp. TMB]|nr:hypothetical protein HWV62_26789 [Athelia sp. TMB]
MHAHVYRFGDSNRASPVFKDLQWTVHEGESWAIISAGRGNQKTTLLQMLLGHLRISPSPPTGLFPFLSAPSSGTEDAPWRDPSAHISIVSFAHRPRSSGGEFYDYTARYGAVREEDRVTLRQSIFPNTNGELDGVSANVFSELSSRMDLQRLLDLPLVALSNGQTRRARILKALLSKPELLLLDEPLTGLDVDHRSKLLSLLHALHTSRSPRIIMALRAQDPVPDWITHVAFVEDAVFTTGPKDSVLSEKPHTTYTSQSVPARRASINNGGSILIDMQNVSVAYHERQVLKNITWTIRAGDRVHLQGANGSGKTTLLSLLTGDHPQSYTQFPTAAQPDRALTLFGRKRRHIPTPELATLIGAVSPEIANAFPRRANTTVWDAVGTGFDGGFMSAGAGGVGIGLKGGLTPDESAWRVARVWEVLRAMGPHTWTQHSPSEAEAQAAAEAFSKRAFVDLTPGEISMVLLMRALVGRPPLLLLDEVWSGMDDGMVAAARAYLRGEGVQAEQAVVVISHWAEEVPWGEDDGLKRFRLENGAGREV